MKTEQYEGMINEESGTCEGICLEDQNGRQLVYDEGVTLTPSAGEWKYPSKRV